MTNVDIAFLGNVGLSVRAIVDLAARAERSGFSGAWMVEYEYDSIAICQAIVAGTEYVDVGTAITRGFTRHPVSFAESAAIIDALSPGRFIVGLGAGPMQRPDPDVPLQRWGLPWDAPAKRLSEYIDVVRLASNGDRFDYRGEYYQLQNVQLDPSPSGGTRVYLAAGGKYMTRVAARQADGMFVHMVNEDLTRSMLSNLRDDESKAGRPAGSVRFTNLLMTCVHADGDMARQSMRRHLVALYLHMPWYQELMTSAGYSTEAAGIATALRAGDTAGAVDAVSDHFIDNFTAAGTPDECRDKVAEMAGWGIDRTVLYALPADGDWGEGYTRAIEAFATQDTLGSPLRASRQARDA